MLAYHQLTHFSGCFEHETKFVLRLLNFEQKQRRMEVAQESLNEVNNDAELLKRVITGNETWVYGTKAQLSQ